MTHDDLDQLLVNLKMKRIQKILPDCLEWAEKEGPSYVDFLSRLLREEYQAQQVRYLANRIKRAKLPERWALETFPGIGNPAFNAQSSSRSPGWISWIERAISS